MQTVPHAGPPLRIAVIGTGISGLSAAWLLNTRHDVTVFEAECRPGGHSNTIDAPTLSSTTPVDTGFIVYNERTYPNLTALFDHLHVPTHGTAMSFSVSCGNGSFDYGGGSIGALIAQKSNLLRPRFWAMLKGIHRFYRDAPGDLAHLEQSGAGIGDYLDEQGYSKSFQDDHLLPMAAAIWSAPCSELRAYPAAAFIRFCLNHGLMQLRDRPKWRSVRGGSREYVKLLTAPFIDRLFLNREVVAIARLESGKVLVKTADGAAERFDHAVIATHADQALALLEAPTDEEGRILGCFRYQKNIAVLHSDQSLMPRRRGIWSAWNYDATKFGDDNMLSVTYWMNRLQDIGGTMQYFVTLNPVRPPVPYLSIKSQTYEHPIFNAAAMEAQKSLWSLQGRQNTWFCGAYFGAGFHEDGLQAGLAVAEQLAGVKRPWQVENESGRIYLDKSGRTAQVGRAA